MSIFASLPIASMVTPPTGYQACQRVALPDATIDELDAMVADAAGKIVRVPMKSKGLRPGRFVAPGHEASYYLIPDDAFEA